MPSYITCAHRGQRRTFARAASLLVVSTLAGLLFTSVQPAPAQAQQVNLVDWIGQVVTDIDLYWGGEFNTAGAVYLPPRWVAFGQPVLTACGVMSQLTGPRYCDMDGTLYVDTTFVGVRYARVGDFAAAIVLAHEVGHHVQNLLGINRLGLLPVQLELNADCLGGMWASNLSYQGRLEPGDVQESVFATASAGDPAGVPWFDPRAHGSPQDRARWLLRGYTAPDVAACNTW
jgi:uncharacterized protein